MQSQELFRTVQRYYNNAYLDREKQDSINVYAENPQVLVKFTKMWKGVQSEVLLLCYRFLGHFQPQHGRPALWELDSDQHLSVGKRDSSFPEEGVRYKLFSLYRTT